MLFVFGCGPSIEITKFTSIKLHPKSGDIDIFTTKENVKKPYKEIALVTADPASSGDSETELLEKVIVKAKEIGADGLIVLPTEEKGEGGILIGNVYASSKRKIVKAVAIIYQEDNK